jgi:hypothetical protein
LGHTDGDISGVAGQEYCRAAGGAFWSILANRWRLILRL